MMKDATHFAYWLWVLTTLAVAHVI